MELRTCFKGKAIDSVVLSAGDWKEEHARERNEKRGAEEQSVRECGV